MIPASSAAAFGASVVEVDLGALAACVVVLCLVALYASGQPVPAFVMDCLASWDRCGDRVARRPFGLLVAGLLLLCLAVGVAVAWGTP